MVGGGPAMARLFELVRRAAPTEGRVLITGENGTGKELVARAIHERLPPRPSARSWRSTARRCPAELIESELFGHERGAFTGAVAARRGKFEQADGGTLFLDEMGDMPPAMQAKLLRVLQEGELERVGGEQHAARSTCGWSPRPTATCRPRWPRDASARTSTTGWRWCRSRVPPLRERREDIPALAEHFLARGLRAATAGAPCASTPRRADSRCRPTTGRATCASCATLVERLAILCDGPALGAADVAGGAARRAHAARPPAPRRRGFHDLVEEAEREIILAALARPEGQRVRHRPRARAGAEPPLQEDACPGHPPRGQERPDPGPPGRPRVPPASPAGSWRPLRPPAIGERAGREGVRPR